MKRGEKGEKRGERGERPNLLLCMVCEERIEGRDRIYYCVLVLVVCGDGACWCVFACACVQ